MKAVSGRRSQHCPAASRKGEDYEELLQNLNEAIQGCLSVELKPIEMGSTDRVVEIII